MNGSISSMSPANQVLTRLRKSLLTPGLRTRLASFRARHAILASEQELAGIFADKTIAVVGNGGSVADSYLGSDIEERDIVVRFNNYVAGGQWAPHVGSRTDVWVTSLCCDVRTEDSARHWFCPFPLQAAKYMRRYGSTNIDALLGFLARGRPLCNQITFRTIEDQIENPSTGAAFLGWLAACRPGLLGVSTFGFSHFSTVVQHHYFEPGGATGHNTTSEREFVAELFG